jgi:biopolymer transport protein ExbB
MNEIFDFLSQGGILMIPLIFSSILTCVIILEKLIDQRYNKLVPKKIIYQIENLSSPNELANISRNCEKFTGIFSSLVNCVLNNKNLNNEQLKEELSDRTRQEMRYMQKGLSSLEIIATVTPVIGLLGTVIGMIKVFTSISKGGIGDPTALSAGISEALLTTASGLTIAIPYLIMFHYFTKKNENLILDMEQYLNLLMNKIMYFKTNSYETVNK